jgi:hypothetical protein
VLKEQAPCQGTGLAILSRKRFWPRIMGSTGSKQSYVQLIVGSQLHSRLAKLLRLAESYKKERWRLENVIQEE